MKENKSNYKNGAWISKILKLTWRIFDLFVCSIIIFLGLLSLLFLKILGKRPSSPHLNTVLSITKDGIYRIIECNGPDYFEWDFTRPHADKTVILFIGDEPSHVFHLGDKVVGINVRCPLENLSRFLPITKRGIQQIIGFIITYNHLHRLSPKILEVMFPSKLALRALLLKFVYPIKLVTQVRGNLDLIYYFHPSPTFLPFQIRNKFFEPFQLLWDKFISQMFYRSCDLVIGYNLNNMLSAISNGAHPAKTRLSRIKIEPTMLSFQPVERHQLVDFPAQGKVISLWSRLSTEKLILECVQAFEHLLETRNYTDQINLIIIGDGPERQRIEDYVARSKFKGNINLLGFRDRLYISSAAQYSDVVLVPYGGSSLVEAVLLGKPVVAFDIEWHNELIRHGETGLLADFPDIIDLANKISEVLADPEKAVTRAMKAKALAELMFNCQTIDQREAHYYGQFLR